ncbi:hypothetical protein [Isoptericola sp. BMS4]|uniref:hypothetical protein n=1 Tax=Isoptericola sp. BMS4 TaxID=2527875 RepID=UPI00141F0DD5|nr:hypothetical protein [Isoptericola sp. BMS4]
MTSPDGPFAPPTLLPSGVAGLLGARADAEDAASRARRSLQIGWESPAAARFRAEVGILLREIDRHLGDIDQAVAVLPR